MTDTLIESSARSDAGRTELVSRLEAKLATARKLVAQTEASVLAKKTVLALLPANLPAAPSDISLAAETYNADAALDFEVTSRQQALELFEALPGVELYFIKGGVSAFVPQERNDHAHPGDNPVEVAPLVYRVAHGVRCVQEEYSWWTRLGGQLLRIRAIDSTSATTKVRAGHSEDKLRWDYSGLPAGVLKYWYGANRRCMAPVTVYQPHGTDIKDAYSRTNTATYVQPAAPCHCD